MHVLAPRFRRLRKQDSRGQIILMVGLATIVMFGIVGLAVDVGRLYVTRVELGRSLDVAALSGILELNGQPSGLANAKIKAEAYFRENEGVGACDNSEGVWCNALADPNANELTIDATKTIRMYFISILGIKTATVSAHAKAGFGTQFLDAVMVLDATQSMVGTPITQAKIAATTFKDILLGSNPQGNVRVGVTAFRGCFRPQPITHSDCVDTGSWVSNLAPNGGSPSVANLNSAINAILGGGGNVGTNVCTGLAMGWNIISGPGNHNDDVAYPGHRQYLILLSDGDNYYPGQNTFQAPLYTSGPYNSASSPTGTTIAGTVFPCQPIDAVGGGTGDSCPSPWNNPSISSTYPCYKGLATPAFTIADNMDSSGWTGGSGWLASSWTTSGTVSKTTSSSPEGSRHVLLERGSSTPSSYGAISRTIDLTNRGATLSYSAKRNSNVSGSDELVVEVDCGSGFQTAKRHRSSASTGIEATGTSYATYSVNLDDYGCYGKNPVTVRFRVASMNSTGDQFYIDSVDISGGVTNSNGYLNGSDASNPGTCNENPRPRERQLDVRTLNLARAMKAQGVEIFVVAFAGGVPGCNLDNTTVYDFENPAQCNTVLDATAGPIGDNTHDGTANHRLLKCIASSSSGTLDHYYYANSATELNAIFTAIANQIAHRLLE